MKFLNRNLYGKVCSLDGEAYEAEWNEQYQKYFYELEKISGRLPKSFWKEFVMHHMHDSILKSINISKESLKSRCQYKLTLCLIDYQNNNIEHILVFTDIKNLRSDLSFGEFSGNCDWLYSEILPIDSKRLSFEVMLFSESDLYFEFSKLHYKKVRLP